MKIWRYEPTGDGRTGNLWITSKAQEPRLICTLTAGPGGHIVDTGTMVAEALNLREMGLEKGYPTAVAGRLLDATKAAFQQSCVAGSPLVSSVTQWDDIPPDMQQAWIELVGAALSNWEISKLGKP